MVQKPAVHSLESIQIKMWSTHESFMLKPLEEESLFHKVL